MEDLVALLDDDPHRESGVIHRRIEGGQLAPGRPPQALAMCQGVLRQVPPEPALLQ